MVKRLVKLVFLSSFFIASISVFASDAKVERDAYNLHQALNYMSIYVIGKCEKALPIVQKHLSEIIEGSKDEPFRKIVTELKKLKSPTRKDISYLENLRMKYGEAIEANSIEHKMVWHREIEKFCPNAPIID